MEKKVIVIGSGFAGLSAATYMAQEGWEVLVVEKNETPGGRAKQLKAGGFTFDMGPSWYWMPDVFERYFRSFGKKVEDYYKLSRLTPSYRIYWNDSYTDIPASYSELKNVFDSFEKGSSKKLDEYLSEAEFKYETGINNLVHKPGRSITEFFDGNVVKGIFRLDVFNSMQKHIQKHFKHPRLRQLMEFPVLFLGALPENIPALYSLMNYADIKLGTWYPKGGMYAVVEGMYKLAMEMGVKFKFNENVKEVSILNNQAEKVITDKNEYTADVVISGADYHFTETVLLKKQYRSYSDAYWDKKVMAPSCLMYYVGLNKKLKNVLHHSLFFDVPFDKHATEIYRTMEWPSDPLFYVSVNSISDASAAPTGGEAIVFLIPVAAGLKNDDEQLREKYFKMIIKRMEQHTGQSISNAIVFKKTYAVSDFVNDYNSYRGNAYGLANTLLQTAIFRPRCKSKKVKNLFYTGQLTVPGPGVPPSLISGEVVAKEVIKEFN